MRCADNNYLKMNPARAQGVKEIGEEQCYIMIGDTLKNDIAFAENIRKRGINIYSIWYNPEKKENQTTHKPDFEIQSLKEIIEILKNF